MSEVFPKADRVGLTGSYRVQGERNTKGAVKSQSRKGKGLHVVPVGVDCEIVVVVLVSDIRKECLMGALHGALEFKLGPRDSHDSV